MGAAFAFIGEMFSENGESDEIEQLTGVFKEKLNDCMEKENDGRLKMTIAIPDEMFLDSMARSLARMVSAGRTWLGLQGTASDGHELTLNKIKSSIYKVPESGYDIFHGLVR